MEKHELIEKIREKRVMVEYKDRDSGSVVYVHGLNYDNSNSTSEAVILASPAVKYNVSLLKDIDHPNIAKLAKVESRAALDTTFLTFEAAGLDLKAYMTQFPDETTQIYVIRYLMNQIVEAVSHYHSKNIVLGRLTPHNVLIDPVKHTVKLAIANFELAGVGPSYKAPEILLGNCKYSYSADIWSVGCIFAEMVIRKPLFQAASEFQEMCSIFRLLGTPIEETWPGLSEFFDVNNFTKLDPKNFAAEFPDLGRAEVDLLRRMLSLRPADRITAANALTHQFFTATRNRFP